MHKNSDELSEGRAIPAVGDLVTVVATTDGQISVLPTYVESQDADDNLRLAIRPGTAPPPPWPIGQPLTLLYSYGDPVLRLRTKLLSSAEVLPLVVDITDDIQEEDRRGHRRVDTVGDVISYKIEHRDIEAVRAQQLNPSSPDGPPLPTYAPGPINLSGSGIVFHSEETLVPTDIVALQLRLPEAPETPIPLVAQVVRRSENHRYAARFVRYSKSDQDRIVYSVFNAYFASLEFDTEGA